MIKLYGDYHTHTIYSHGKGTILDNVLEARKKGLREIAITDHGPDHYMFGIKRSDIIRMREEIDIINDSNGDIKVLLGVESNLISLDGDIDVDEDDLKYLDILLLGYHSAVAVKTPGDFKMLYIDNLSAKFSKRTYDKAIEQNTSALIKAIKGHKIDIITHPGAKIPIDTASLAEAASLRGTALEINSSHGYLTAEYVRAAMASGVNFVINSDAHTPARVGCFDAGIRTAEEAGLSAERIINAENWE